MHAPLLLALLLAAGGAEPAPAADTPAAAPAPAACPPTGSVVAVFTRKRQLWLCRDGVEEARFPVALGRSSGSKRRTGDGRTPAGSYGLGDPRPSAQFGVFIPIEYPTPEQAATGHTGDALGIHGPPRGQAEPEYPTTAVDWTLGCIATGTDADARAIADFVRRNRPVVVIR